MAFDDRFQPFKYTAEAIRRGKGDEINRCYDTAKEDRKTLKKVFANHPDEMHRADLEVDISMLVDTFAISGFSSSDASAGNAIVTALSHNIARYVAMAAITGSDPYLVMNAVETRIRAETARLLEVYKNAG